MTLAETIRIVASGLAAVTEKVGTYQQDPRGFHARHKVAIAELSERLATDVGARITDRWDGARVRIAGISSTSTAGVHGALSNWLTAARKREGAA